MPTPQDTVSETLPLSDGVSFEPGELLTRHEFHERYRQMAGDVRAELIGGVVYMPAALRMPHGRYHMLVNIWLGQYWTATPGTDIADNATVLLGDDSEPQPDALMRIIGGHSQEDEEGYLVGPPELVVEVASSSKQHDQQAKRADYERWGVQEYLVLLIEEQRAVWFVRHDGAFEELSPTANGILKSLIFPGLWLDSAAFFARDTERMQHVLQEGLDSSSHAEFVKQLKSEFGETL